MRRNVLTLVIIFVLSLVLTMPATASAQEQQKQVPKSLKASVIQRLGLDTDITIVYSRPGVKGRTIWGELVPWGLAEGNKYSDNKPYPWRAGANENTTIEFSKDVMIDGNKVPAGKYSIHMIPGEKEWAVIFNRNNSGWGSYKYNQDEDLLRITVTPVVAPHQEWLVFGFEDLAGTSATAFLHWEKIKIPFNIETVQ